MELLITHKSALEYWRLHGMTQVDPALRQRRRMPPEEALASSELKSLDIRGLTLPLEVMVGAHSAIRKLQKVKTHTASAPLPEGSIIEVGEGFFVASPELCFFQLVNRLPLAKVLRLGLELCGKYSLPANAAAHEDPEIKEKGFKNRPALTSIEKLSSYLARSGGMFNQRQLQSILHYIGNGSASPMETKLLIMLILPYKHGGYALPMPELDEPVESALTTRKKSKKSGFTKQSKQHRGYRCDLYWRDLKLAVEYDSDWCHLLSKQKAEDSKKKNYLLSKGIHVITVSKLQIQDVDEVESVAKQLAVCHGKQLKHKKNPKWVERHNQLRDQLKV